MTTDPMFNIMKNLRPTKNTRISQKINYRYACKSCGSYDIIIDRNDGLTCKRCGSLNINEKK